MKLIIEMNESDYNALKNDIDRYAGYDDPLDNAVVAVVNGVPLPQCKDCKYFEYDSVAKVDGIPLIVAHEICNKWGEGCKTSENGYCFLFEADREVENG